MANTINHNRTALLNRICAVLMAALLLLQFVPFWQYGNDGEMASISQYIWFPSDYAQVGEAIEDGGVEGFTINDILGSSVLILFLSVVGMAFCLLRPDQPLVTLLPIACGLTGVIGYLGSAAMRMGHFWWLHALTSAAMLVLGVYALALTIKDTKDE